MAEEVAAGGVVFRRTGRVAEVLLIQDRFGCWTLPKGKIDPGEEHPRAALREIQEETGLAGTIRAELDRCQYTYLDRDSRVVAKTVTYYLVEATGGDLRPGPGEVLDVSWCPLEEALSRSDYPNDCSVLEKAAEWLSTRR